MAVEQFGHYRLEELIGRGGMGEVYRAFDTVKGRMDALERLPVALAADAEFQASFRKESARAARLSELPPSRAVDIVSQVARALDAAHSDGLVTATSSRRTC